MYIIYLQKEYRVKIFYEEIISFQCQVRLKYQINLIWRDHKRVLKIHDVC